MKLMYCKLMSADGGTHEATAFATRNGELLPPGTWRIIRNYGIRQESIMTIEEMPDHWQRQLDSSGRFGVSLGVHE